MSRSIFRRSRGRSCSMPLKFWRPWRLKVEEDPIDAQEPPPVSPRRPRSLDVDLDGAEGGVGRGRRW